MIIEIAISALQKLKPLPQAIERDLKYSAKKRYALDLRKLTDDEQAKLLAIAKADKAFGWRALESAMQTMAMMKADPTGTPIKSVKMIQLAMIEHFVASAPRKWVFMTKYGQRFPYYVTSIDYHPTKVVRQRGDESYTIPEHVDVHLRAAGESKTLTFRSGDIHDSPTVGKLLARNGIKVETKQLVDAYEYEMGRYMTIVEAVGELYAATGTALVSTNSWYSSDEELAMEREGAPAKVIIDDGSEHEKYTRRGRGRSGTEDSSTIESTFWDTFDANQLARAKELIEQDEDAEIDDSEAESGGQPDAESDNLVSLPKHPWVPVFDLERHQFITIHASELEPWEFDKSLGDKLVLPPGTTQVIRALIHGSQSVMEDIVKGKTGGTIIICDGKPGLGKTLSAEVFAEIMEKPLYVVQCSQLGLNPEELEKELGIVLARANRWKCILLIDEADVYVRERGNEITQNAIVGVWLRVLEYYRGILFLTTNKGKHIDDAVISRATAVIRFKPPTSDELFKIWSVLLAQYEMEVSPALIPELVKEWPAATGRNVKNLIKLTRSLQAAGVGNDIKGSADQRWMALFKLAARFLDIEQPDEKNLPS